MIEGRAHTAPASVEPRRLPGLDGFSVAVELRRLYGPNLTLIAMSGYSAMDIRLRAEQVGFDDFLVNPINMPALLNQLEGMKKSARPSP